MGLKNFIINGINTTQKIYKAGIHTMSEDKITFLHFFGSALKDSSIGAYYVFLKSEIDGLTKQNQIESIKNETSDKVACLIGGYYLNPASLLNLKTELEAQGVQVHLINERYTSKKSLLDNVSELKNQLQSNKEKDIVLFGYSSGGMIAHKIGNASGYKSVSFGTSENPSETMVGTLISLTKNESLKNYKIPDTGVNIIESFSAIVPNDGDIPDNTIRLKNTYSHMTVGREDVIEKITKEILKSFKI